MRFGKWVIFNEKHAIIFLHQMEAIVFIIFQIIFVTHGYSAVLSGTFLSRDQFNPIFRERQYLTKIINRKYFC